MAPRPAARRQEQVLACARSLGFQHYVHAPDVPLLGGWASVLGGWASPGESVIKCGYSSERAQ
jgi:hypothetical protein